MLSKFLSLDVNTELQWMFLQLKLDNWTEIQTCCYDWIPILNLLMMLDVKYI